jgi:hypothetical protein
MVIQHPQALRGQSVDIGCLDLTSIATDVGEPLSPKYVSIVRVPGVGKTCQVICEDEEEIGSLRLKLRSAAHDEIKDDW